MIWNIIKVALFFAVVVSASSMAQVATALDLSLEDYPATDSHYPYTWTPDVAHQQSNQNFSSMVEQTRKRDSGSPESTQRELSLEVFQGDGLDDFRQNRGQHNIDILPEQDTETYGVSVKQRF